MREDLKFVYMAYGVQCLMMDLMIIMLESYVTYLDSGALVRYTQIPDTMILPHLILIALHAIIHIYMYDYNYSIYIIIYIYIYMYVENVTKFRKFL